MNTASNGEISGAKKMNVVNSVISQRKIRVLYGKGLIPHLVVFIPEICKFRCIANYYQLSIFGIFETTERNGLQSTETRLQTPTTRFRCLPIKTPIERQTR